MKQFSQWRGSAGEVQEHGLFTGTLIALISVYQIEQRSREQNRFLHFFAVGNSGVPNLIISDSKTITCLFETLNLTDIQVWYAQSNRTLTVDRHSPFKTTSHASARTTVRGESSPGYLSYILATIFRFSHQIP